MNVVVKYDGVEIVPPPFVSRSMEAVDYGNRWGYATNIDLNGYFTGAYINTGSISGFTGIFNKSFKALQVYDENGDIFYEHSGCVVVSASVSKSTFFSGNPMQYSVKLKAYDVPSGVIDISDEYSFSDSEDGSTTVSHKISAKGIGIDRQPAINNAFAFVNLLTGKMPYAPIFVGNSGAKAVLLNLSESVDRVNSSYSVTENWKYTTGYNEPYVKTLVSLNKNDDFAQDYVSLDFTVNFQGDKFSDDNYYQNFENHVASYNYADDLTGKYGVDQNGIEDIFLNTFSINKNSGARTYDLSFSLLSGNKDKLSGYFEDSISYDLDAISNKRTYSLQSQFVCLGPAHYKTGRLDLFTGTEIAADYGSLRNYSYLTIKNSNLWDNGYSGFNGLLNPTPISYTENFNKKLGTFSLSASYSDEDYISNSVLSYNSGDLPISSGKADYSFSLEPENWIVRQSPSANVEGLFLLQNLNVKTREKIKISLNAINISNPTGAIGYTGYLNNILENIKSTCTGIRSFSPALNFYLTEFSTTDNIGKNISMNASYTLSDALSTQLNNQCFIGSYVGNNYTRKASAKYGH